ncbi:pseudaminic acid cytidylyltransferase [Marinobacter panjinensis]|uniref:Pseudaminic acid cytidylyltransferase n=1 Tax=Marinobacter panjinensis TaxID=2576384 RepID=A0A4U6R486_9GAMM|nr:pseudaminic acid cytidylyltransferase [Marinobacter panjinensis]MCR8913697.1 pseudaminic acid cytidylyltransferase [Marinobacter panjinensis]TKV67652.1 pseudaminic acid cytidylyltransferase [Marinobacter panjinensis]
MITPNRVAIIPARGGSKRIPRKNVRDFCSKPMIAWSIDAAWASGCFDRIIVSTDDPEIAEVAIEYGAEVPFIRPPELSDDYAGTIPVIRHAVNWIQQNGEPVDYACCIYATAPFISPEDLQRGWELIQQKAASYVFAVTNYAFPIQRALRITDSGRVAMFNPEHFNTRSQDLEEAWHDAGQFYWGSAEAWLKEMPVFSERAMAVKLPRSRVQDIDTPEDWTYAELMFRVMERVKDRQ